MSNQRATPAAAAPVHHDLGPLQVVAVNGRDASHPSDEQRVLARPVLSFAGTVAGRNRAR